MAQQNELCELLKGLGNNEVPIVQVCDREILNPDWYKANNVIVQKSMPNGDVNPNATAEIKQIHYLQNLTTVHPTVPMKDQGLTDDIHNGVTCCMHPVTGKVVSGWCPVKSMHQFSSAESAVNVASYLKRLGSQRRRELFDDGSIQLFLAPECISHEPDRAAAERLRNWYVGDGAANPGAKALTEQAIIAGKLRLWAGIHGSVFYEGALVGADDIWSCHACLTVIPIAGSAVAIEAARLENRENVDESPHRDCDGRVVDSMAGMSLLIAVDCQSSSLERQTNRQLTEARRRAKQEKKRVEAQRQFYAKPPPTNPVDRSEYERMCAAHEAREAREMQDKRAEVIARRAAIKEQREKAAVQKARKSVVYTPRGHSQKKNETKVDVPLPLSAKVKEEARRSMSIEEAEQHELDLKDAERTRIAAIETKREAQRIAREIGGA